MWQECANNKKTITIQISEEVLAKFSEYIGIDSLDEVIELAMRNYIVDQNKVKNITPIDKVNGVFTFRSSMKSDQFIQYLTEIALKSNREHYSLNTANGYKSAINTISEIITTDLWGITTVEEISEIMQELEYNSNYNKINEERNKTLSNGLARYGEFLDYLKNDNVIVREEKIIKENGREKAKSKVRDWAYKDNDFHKIITAFFIAKNFFDDRKINKYMLKTIFERIGGTNWGYFSPMSNGNPDSSTGQFFLVSYDGIVKLSHEEITKTLTEYANCYYDENQEDYYKKIVECL